MVADDCVHLEHRLLSCRSSRLPRSTFAHAPRSALPLRIESDRLTQISDRFLMPSVMEMNLPAAGQRIDVAHIQLQSAGVGLYGQVQLIEPLIDRAQMAIVEAIERLGRDQPLIDLPGLREPPRGEQVVTDFGDLV